MKLPIRKKAPREDEGHLAVDMWDHGNSLPVIESPERWQKEKRRWNRLIYEQANRNHLHQDKLRWSLAGGFGLFFLTGMAAVNNPQLDKAGHLVFHELQFALVVLGTIYLFVLMIEGWYGLSQRHCSTEAASNRCILASAAF